MPPLNLFDALTESQKLHKEQLMKVLKNYLPPVTVGYCSELIMNYKLHLHIEVERKDRLGDYSPHLGKGNRISINHNLNPYDFLITFIHELAHHTAHKKFGNHHQPHGKEWKDEFKYHMRSIVRLKFFPPDVEQALIKHMQSPSYTHTGDLALTRVLMKYNKVQEDVLLDDLPEGAIFKVGKSGRVKMKKGVKRRTYIHCTAIDTNKEYLIHAVARVIPL